MSIFKFAPRFYCIICTLLFTSQRPVSCVYCDRTQTYVALMDLNLSVRIPYVLDKMAVWIVEGETKCASITSERRAS